MLRIAAASSLLLFFSFHWAEDDFSKIVIEKLEAYRHTLPQEKAYLHLDKPYYVTGDTLWFNAYLVEGSVHVVDSASQVLYVDLIEKRTGKNITIKRVNLEGGIGKGEIKLGDTLPKGAYTIRAYTNWMRNFDEDFFFHKDIFLFNDDVQQPEKPVSALDVQFFPEGGQLIAGLGTRIAFKAVNESGLGPDVNGFILNQNKDTISALNSEHLGMGKFTFQPQSGQTYTAYLRKKGEPYQTFPFPEVKTEGYLMMVNNLTVNNKIRVLIYGNLADNIEHNVNVVAQTRGVVVFTAKGKVSKKGLQLLVPADQLPAGITQLTLFDDQNKPVCERLIFVDHGDHLNVHVNTHKKTFRHREKTEVEITVTDTTGKPVETNLSVAVTDNGQIAQQPYDQHITSYLLLSSDLKGHIEQPGYYFDTTHTDRKIKLDLLMMTQGWRRFTWQNALKDTPASPSRYIEKGFSIQGEVKKSARKPAEKVTLSLHLSNDSVNTFLTTETGETGLFAVDNLIFNDSLKVRLQGMNSRTSAGLNISVSPFSPPRFTISRIPFFPVTVDAVQMETYLKRAEEYLAIERRIRESKEKMLKEVTVKGKKEVVRDSRKLYSHADATIKLSQQAIGGAMTVLDVLQGRVAGLQVTGSGSNARVSIRGSRSEPTFLLDGLPVDKDMITSLSIYDLESVDVLKGASAAIYGGQGGSGVISVLTKRANPNYDYSQDVTPGVTTTKIAGFDTPKEFYAPKYDVNIPENNIPDYRSTVYWAPMLKTDKNGKVSFSYFNTDATSDISLHVEALSAWGISGHSKTEYSVR